MDNEGSDGILEGYFLKSFLLLTLYQAYNILSERGYGFSCELNTYLEKPFAFFSMITNNLLCLLLSFQSVEPSLFQVPPARLTVFLVTPGSCVPERKSHQLCCLRRVAFVRAGL